VKGSAIDEGAGKCLAHRRIRRCSRAGNTRFVLGACWHCYRKKCKRNKCCCLHNEPRPANTLYRQPFRPSQKSFGHQPLNMLSKRGQYCRPLSLETHAGNLRASELKGSRLWPPLALEDPIIGPQGQRAPLAAGYGRSLRPSTANT
jgi:hypothetical protein